MDIGDALILTMKEGRRSYPSLARQPPRKVVDVSPAQSLVLATIIKEKKKNVGFTL